MEVSLLSTVSYMYVNSFPRTLIVRKIVNQVQICARHRDKLCNGTMILALLHHIFITFVSTAIALAIALAIAGHCMHHCRSGLDGILRTSCCQHARSSSGSLASFELCQEGSLVETFPVHRPCE